MATMTQQARPPVLAPPSGRAGFPGALRSEFTKIRSVAIYTLILLIVGAILFRRRDA